MTQVCDTATTHFVHSPLWSYLIFELTVTSSCTLFLSEGNNFHKRIFSNLFLSFARAAARELTTKPWPGDPLRFIPFPSFDDNQKCIQILGYRVIVRIKTCNVRIKTFQRKGTKVEEKLRKRSLRINASQWQMLKRHL